MKDAIVRAPRLARNYVILSGAELASKILAAVAFIYLARLFGPVSYGLLEFAIALTFLFALLVDGGMSSHGARELAKDKSLLAKLLVHITLLRFLLAVVAFAILEALISATDQPPVVKRLIFFYGLTLFTLPGLIQWVYQGQDKMHFVALASMLRWLLFSAGIFIFVQQAGQLWLVPLVEGVAILCTVLFLVVSLIRTESIHLTRPSLRFAAGTFRYSFPIGASEMIWAIRVYFATIVLGLFVRGPEVGWFGGAHRIVIALHTFIWLYFYNLLPSIARSSLQPGASLQGLMRVSMQVTGWLAVFAGVSGMAVAAAVIALVYGPQYEETSVVFQILVWLLPLSLISGHYRYILIGYKHQGLELLSASLGAAFAILLLLVLLPSPGLAGAAWAIVLSELAVWASAYVFVRRTVAPVPFLTYLWRPLLSGLLIVGLLQLLPPLNAWLAAAITGVTFVICLLVLQPDLIASLRRYWLGREQRLLSQDQGL